MDCPSRSTVERWAARFQSRNTDATDLPRSGRPVPVTTPENVALIESIVVENKCITIDQFEQGMEVSSVAIHSTLTIQLGYRSFCGKWVPHNLSDQQKLARVNTAKKLLETYEDCDPRRLAEVLTGAETWVYYSTPYSKYKMRSWVKGDERPEQIPKPDFRKSKVMYTTFFNSGGIVLQLPFESGKTVNATFLQRKCSQT